MSRPKAVIYTRVSTDKQAEEGTSLEVQESACLRKAQDLGAEVVDVQTDEGVSGAFYLSRPGIQRALRQIEEGKANVLITMKLDRSGRDADVLGAIRKRVVNAGAKLVFVDGMNFENNASGNLMFRVNAGFAEYEREVIRERTTGGRRKRAEGGLQPSRTLSPYGYRVVTKPDVLNGTYPAELLGTYQIVEEQAQWVRTIFAKYAGGMAARKIKLWLEDQGVLSPCGCRSWSQPTLTRMLANPVYKGRPAFGRTQRKVDEARLTNGFKRTDYAVGCDESQWVYLDCEPLVSAEAWDVCQRRLRKNKETYSGNPKRRYLLGGFVVCPICRRRTAGTRCGKVRYYACPYDRKCGYRCNATQAESAVSLSVRTVAGCPELTEKALRAYDLHHRHDDDAAEYDRLKRALEELNKQEKATAKAQVDAIMKGRSTAVYDTLLAEIGTQRAAITARLTIVEAGRAQAAAMEPKTAAQKVAIALAIVKEVLEDPLITDAEKNRILSNVVRSVCQRQEDRHWIDVFLAGLSGAKETDAQILIRVSFTSDMPEAPCTVKLAEWPIGDIHCTLPTTA